MSARHSWEPLLDCCLFIKKEMDQQPTVADESRASQPHLLYLGSPLGLCMCLRYLLCLLSVSLMVSTGLNERRVSQPDSLPLSVCQLFVRAPDTFS